MAASTQAPALLTSWQDFNKELEQRAAEIASQLPSTVTAEKFKNAAIAAVKRDPEILECTPRSIFTALVQAAQDGLIPDGKEGVINGYYNKDVKAKEAKWNPMTHGLRKRALELAGMVIDAQVVYLNDQFVWHQGDQPRIEHTPPALGQPRGEKIGAYAIFKANNGAILHREVMDYGQIEKVKSCSRNPTGLLWTKFEEEGFRKTVIRRGIKTVPVSEDLEQVFTRDDDDFAFDDPPADPNVAIPPRPRQSEFARPTPQKPSAITAQPEPLVLDASVKRDAETVQVKRDDPVQQTASLQSTQEQANNAPVEEKPEPKLDPREQERLDWIKDAYTELDRVKVGPKPVRAITDHETAILAAGAMTDLEEAEWGAACEKARREIMDAKKGNK